jgi:ParB family chromosome partitioning protein
LTSTADKLQKKFGNNLSESLGARTTSSEAPRTLTAVPMTVSPDDGRTRARETGHMEIERIVPDPNQPRKVFDEHSLDRLAGSMKRHGQLLPVRVRWHQDLGKWVLISGERRYQAAKRAGMTSLSCVFVDRELTGSEILQEQIVENSLREDLRPIEQAKAYKTLMEINNWNGSQLSEALHVSKATVSRVLALLKLPDDIQSQVDKGEIPATAAYELVKLPTAEAQREMALQIISGGFTRYDAIDAIRQEVDRLNADIEAALRPIGTAGATVTDAPPEFRGETTEASYGFSGDTDFPDNSFAAKLAETENAPAAVGATTIFEATATVEQPVEIPAVKPTRKPGKPRTGTKERAFRVEGARVVVTFSKKVPKPEEIIAALEQALATAREDARNRSVA